MPAQLESSDSESEASVQSESADLIGIHPLPYIRCLIYLVAVLHTKHHASYQECALILKALGFILRRLPGNLLTGDEDDIPKTLTTVFNRLGLGDKFKIHPICHVCYRIFTGDEGTTFCPTCLVEIYRPRGRQLFRRLFGAGLGGDDNEDDLGFNPQRTPNLVQPIQSLADGLREFLARPGMVDAINKWKTRQVDPDELKSIQDGNAWKTVKGPDGRSFFFHGDSGNEIRLGLSMSLDWFSKKTSSYGPSHSSGVLSFSIQNLEDSLR
ncbi:hypothetical protein R3P38DRAFT_2565973 [Favolaschia claudopus]|uniref:Uncharacterized protein n=1 Tax=Favolaschia claudopus TaxID=2862362 RepID=A0AAV9ZZX6_9AGAR